MPKIPARRASDRRLLYKKPMRIACLAIPLALCTCAAETIDYVGTMRPLAGTCDPASEASATLRATNLIFAPASGTLLLRGEASAQNLTASLALTDPDKRPYTLTFQGTLKGKDMAGTYTTPSCRYDVALHRTNG